MIYVTLQRKTVLSFGVCVHYMCMYICIYVYQCICMFVCTSFDLMQKIVSYDVS